MNLKCCSPLAVVGPAVGIGCCSLLSFVQLLAPWSQCRSRLCIVLAWLPTKIFWSSIKISAPAWMPWSVCCSRCMILASWKQSTANSMTRRPWTSTRNMSCRRCAASVLSPWTPRRTPASRSFGPSLPLCNREFGWHCWYPHRLRSSFLGATCEELGGQEHRCQHFWQIIGTERHPSSVGPGCPASGHRVSHYQQKSQQAARDLVQQGHSQCCHPRAGWDRGHRQDLGCYHEPLQLM